MNKYDDGTLYRISKAEAKKRFVSGKHIIMLPCKANPRSPWYEHLYHDRLANHDWIIKDDPVSCENGFKARVDSFIYYCCQYAETGLYPAFYVDRNFKEELEK